MVDYVIVGAGSAGCVLAARLSEDPDVRVLLLEAGGSDASLLVRGPALYNLLWRSQRDWAFRTEPQAACGGRRHFWPRGKVLGGSSSLNVMVYIRGHRSNYDEWRDLGSPGWGYDDVLPYFKRSENWHGPPSQFHGEGGPLDVRSAGPHAPSADAFVDAAIAALGVRRNDDFNGKEQEGVGHYQFTVRGGRRWSAADAFLRPALARKNLEVVSNAHATRVVIEKGRAVGVEYATRRGERKVVRATREVVLAGGSIGSPQLLMLSGIGPADHLRSHGIEVVHDLPGVGQNLQDHLMSGVQLAVSAAGSLRFGKVTALAWMARYALFGTGPFTHPAVHTGGFVRTDASLTRPDLQFHVVPWGVFTPNTDEPGDPDAGRFLTILPSLIYPKSRGEIRLRSADPFAPPAIDPRYFSEPDDLALLVRGTKLARAIAAEKPLAPMCQGEVRPGPLAKDDAAIEEAIRVSVNTIFHPVGTCKMGTDDAAVVDPELRVRGVPGLRVVDGSIMPTIVGGNTHAPIVMIAEKASDLLRGKAPQP